MSRKSVRCFRSNQTRWSVLKRNGDSEKDCVIFLMMTVMMMGGQMQYVEFGDFSGGIVTDKIRKTAPNQAQIISNLYSRF